MSFSALRAIYAFSVRRCNKAPFLMNRSYSFQKGQPVWLNTDSPNLTASLQSNQIESV